MDDKELMDIILKIAIGIIGCILGGFSVHLYYKSKINNINTKLVNKNGDNAIAKDGSIVAKDYHPTIYVSATPEKKIPEPSKQANSIITQLIENQSESFAVYEPVGKVEGITMIESRKEMVLEEPLRVPDDLEALEANGFLRYSKPNSTGHIYALTPKGLEYGKSLIS